MNDRRKLMVNGHISVGVAIHRGGKLAGTPDIRIRGVPVEDERERFLQDAVAALTAVVQKAAGRQGDIEALREAIRLAVRRTAADWTGKKPIVDVTIVEAG